MLNVPYDPVRGRMYARSFALYENLPEDQRLFYYAEGEDCTNFISQCVWAAYGGWVPGFTPQTVRANSARILGNVRQVAGVWYGSRSNIGSEVWCRVEEFYDRVTSGREEGPSAELVAQGPLSEVDPSLLKVGNVVQLVVTPYAPERFGHGLYVTQEGDRWDDVLICCHTYDRLDRPMLEFASQPEIYPRMRLLRFREARFSK